MTSPSAQAATQYAATTGNLTARMALHEYGTNPQDWFSWLASRLPRSGRILEVGAGTGELWRRLGHDGLDLTVTDFSPAMCARLADLPGVRVRRCDAGALPFSDGSFDAVIANHMLYHVDDPAAVLRELARVSRPGGRLAVATNGHGHMAEITELSTAIGRPDIMPRAGQSDFYAESGPALVSEKFQDVRVERYPGDLAVPAVAPVVDYLNSMAGEPLTAEQVAAAGEIVSARIAADGVFRVRKNVVLITAVR
ncbi:ubiquinone/menaquinone biosynthesis C-methylase UbiE [Actinoplanes tereljensis]|uniref:Methyltransferase type 11 domain-containing protein n=1 Tax=Paractinoplanes tereljensis TaxID=571912 RepID=A0A919TUG8_9ACTN|nr:class I SAM-dependent methyltransferase [Actinoplanes tereljensis]GIF22309.1 hypothetical protein Ate02nite_50390 [Actinoplanes tereljensis]